MYKMQVSTQTDNHNLRSNVGSDEKYILRKKFQSPKFNILCKIALYTYLCFKI